MTLPLHPRPKGRLRSIAVLLLFLGGLVATLYGVQTWHDNRAWKQYERQARMQGVPLDWRTDWPKRSISTNPIPQTDFTEFIRLFDQANDLVRPIPVFPRMEDLSAWDQAFTALKSGKQPRTLEADGFRIQSGAMDSSNRTRSAEVVLEGFGDDDTFLDKVRTICHRPDPLFPFSLHDSGAYSNQLPTLPNTYDAIAFGRALKLKSVAEIAAGKHGAALRGLDLLLCVSESLKHDPTLISFHAHLFMVDDALRGSWEGLALRAFTDAELAQLQLSLGSDDLLAFFCQAALYDRAAVLSLFDQVKRTGLQTTANVGGNPRSLVSTVFKERFLPDKLNYVKAVDSVLSSSFSTSGTCRIHPAQLTIANAAVQAQLRAGPVQRALRLKPLSSMFVPAFERVCNSTCRVQVTRDHARLACGLERYYLKHRQYPEKLEQVVPEFLSELPLDPVAGGPYKYAPDSNGRYRIWSVGWDEKDDHGVAGPGGAYDNTGDWVWQYPSSLAIL